MMTRTLQGYEVTNLSLFTNYEDPNLVKLEGFIGGTSVANTQYFIQLFNQTFASLVSGVTVPSRSLQVLGQDGFTFSYLDEGLSLGTLPGALASANANWIVVLSTTDNVYTAVGAGITMDIQVDVEEFEIELAGTTTQTNYAISPVGNLYLQLVADTLGNTNKLVSLDITETGGVASYIMLFAKTVNMTTPIRQIPLPANGNVKLKFGPNENLYQQDADGTQHYGIIVTVSSTTGTLTVGHATINSATYL